MVLAWLDLESRYTTSTSFFLDETDTHGLEELQMRRPHKERYRLDKLLKRKAEEGVKIYVIL